MRGDGRTPVESTGNCVPVTEIARSVATHGVVDLIGGLGSTADVHGVRAVVETVVAGRDGRVIAVHAGAVPTLDEEDKLKVRPRGGSEGEEEQGGEGNEGKTPAPR